MALALRTRVGTALAKAATRLLDPDTLTRAITANDDWAFTIVRGSNPDQFQGKGSEVRLRGWERHPVVNACVRAIVDILSAVEFEVYKKKSDGTDEVIPNHDAAVLLNVEPRADLSGYALRGRFGTHFLIYGNAPWHIERAGRKRVAGITPIHPENITQVEVNGFDQIVRYHWQTVNGRAMVSPVEDIVHFRDLTASVDALFGFPRAAAALQDIVSDSEATQYVRQVVTNHGAPGVVIIADGAPSATDLSIASEKWHQDYVEMGKRGRTKFVAGVKDIKEIGFSLSDLEFPDLRSIAREGICACFNVDPRIIGVQSAKSDGGLSGEQYREARFRLIQQAVMPIMKCAESELNRWFMPEFGDVYIRFNADQLSELTEDEQATSTRALAELDKGAITVEEFRTLTGRGAELDPEQHVIQGGRIVKVAIALEEASKSPLEKAEEIAATMPAPPGDGKTGQAPSSNGNGNGNSGNGSRPMIPAAARSTDEGPSRGARFAPRPAVSSILASATNGTRSEVAAIITAPHVEHPETAPLVVIPLLKLTPEQRLARWQSFDIRATRDESAYAVAARILFEVERQGVAHLLADDPAIDAIIADLAHSYSDDGKYFRAWVRRYEALIGDTMQSAAEDVLAPLGLDFDLENPRVRELLTTRVNMLAGNVTDTTYQQILGFLDVGRAAGMGTRDIADLINEGVFGGNADARSLTIARTESVSALNAGEFAAAVDSGVFQAKEWLTQGDARVRDSHAAIDGERVAVGVPFSNGLMYPGDQIGTAADVCNCRCTVLFHDTEA